MEAREASAAPAEDTKLAGLGTASVEPRGRGGLPNKISVALLGQESVIPLSSDSVRCFLPLSLSLPVLLVGRKVVYYVANPKTLNGRGGCIDCLFAEVDGACTSLATLVRVTSSDLGVVPCASRLMVGYFCCLF